MSWDETDLWRDVHEIPAALRATFAARDGFAATAAVIGDARRVVTTGNGAAYYVGLALWLASLEGADGPPVEAVPGGLVANGAFRWRDGDRLLAVSSSGEFRDVVEAIEHGAPRPSAAVTAHADSSVGRTADARALQVVLSQRAVTHTQAFCGGVAVALAVWAEVTDDDGLRAELAGLPDAVERAIAATETWMAGLGTLALPAVAVALGSGPAWAGALEAALFLKEVAGIPTEGCETREGATTAMFACAPGHLVLSLATRADPLLDEAERLCAAQGATVVRVPGGDVADRRLAPITALPAITAIAAHLALLAGRNPDKPDWEDAYYSTARGPR
jgi:glucosamine--fructose-6-phosphate aminotransferase (isomerizing)